MAKKKAETDIEKTTRESKARVLVALEKSLGVVTSACRTSNVSRTQFYEWCKVDAKFKEEVDDISEIAIDFVESKLHLQIEEGNTSATIFFLKCKGKKRGFVEKTETDLNISGISIPVINWVGDGAEDEESN